MTDPQGHLPELARLGVYVRKLRQAGMRVTRQRRQIVMWLMDNVGWSSVDRIRARLRRAYRSDFHASTVYGALRALAAAGVVEPLLAPACRRRTLVSLRDHARGHVHYWGRDPEAPPSRLPLSADARAALDAFFASRGLPVAAYYVVARGHGLVR